MAKLIREEARKQVASVLAALKDPEKISPFHPKKCPCRMPGTRIALEHIGWFVSKVDPQTS